MGRNKEEAYESRICSEGYSEQDWAEYALGGWDAERGAAMERHRLYCEACAGADAEWRRLLAAETGEGAAHTAEAYPSERTRRSLLRAVERRAWRSRLLQRPARLSLAAGVLGLLLFGMLARVAIDPAEPAQPDVSFVSSREPAAVTVMQAADTQQYRVMPATGGQSGGYVWLSGDVSEALLLLEGLPLLDQEDYQAWAVSGGRMDSLGLLTLTGTRGHLHVRSAHLRGADTISLSSEPKGGSDFPTSEQTVLVLFGR